MNSVDAANDLLLAVDVSDTSMSPSGTSKKLKPETLLAGVTAALAAKVDDSEVGTTANKIVRLTSDAKLPAVDGSLLTNVSGGAGTLEKATNNIRWPKQAGTQQYLRPLPYIDDNNQVRSELPYRVESKLPKLECTFTQKQATSTYSARDGAGLVYIGTDAYLIGGWNPFESWGMASTNEVWKSTDDGATWTKILSHDSTPGATQFTPRHSFGCFVKSSYIYVMGSDQFDPAYPTGEANVWRSTDGITWGKTNSVAPGWAGKVLIMFGDYEGDFYAVGGQTDLDDPTTADSEVWKSTDNGATWTQLADAPFAARGGNSHLVEFDGFLWVLGGSTYATFEADRDYYTDIWKFDGTTWTEVLSDGNDQLPPLGYANTFVYNSRMWISRGYWDTSNRDNVFCTEDGITWREITNSPLPESHADATGVGPNGVLFGAGNYTFTSRPVYLMTGPAEVICSVEVRDDRIVMTSGLYSVEESLVGGQYTIDYIGSGVQADVKINGVSKFRVSTDRVSILSQRARLQNAAYGWYSDIYFDENSIELHLINGGYTGSVDYCGWRLKNWNGSAFTDRLFIHGNGQIDLYGALKPATLADVDAPVGSIYYSSTAGKLVYKDAGGTVNNLY